LRAAERGGTTRPPACTANDSAKHSARHDLDPALTAPTMLTSRERVLAVAISLVAAACERAPTAPPADALRFDPPEHFRALWAATEQCSGHQRSFDVVRWYEVPDAWQVPNHEGTLVAAFYDLRGNYIVIAGAYLASDPLVRHEELHAILDRPGHPAEFDRCDLRLED
jgi:hypothetical protein